jgi:hypothetical protein
MRSVDRLGLLVCGVCLGTNLLAADEQPADAEFLEYLGMWEETDEEWELHDGILAAEDAPPSDPATEDEESPEREDDS